MLPKKQKKKKEHKLKKGHGNKLSTHDLADLIELLMCVEDISDIFIDECTYDALKYITHYQYSKFISEYYWIRDIDRRLTDDECIQMMEYLFKEIPPNIDVFYDFYK